jgi:alkanesulfonate monooxygenase SsuD/methylene tetrahydromethanopterin reductase-like flavin-dependent oxidoreductase (luciferase family)
MLDPVNRLKLAVFCANVARGTSISLAESLPEASWEESARLARAADRAGIDAMIPLGRWKNNARTRPDDDRFLEPFTWAAGLAAITERIGVFATVHMTLFHPVIAAGMASTIDHISGGRFAINVVAGFNDLELRMFGIEQMPHEDRYELADEWMSLVKRIWTSEEPFDHHGRFYDSVEVISKPLPVQKPHPVLMSAGASPAGRRFAARQTDLNFVHLPSFEGMPAAVAAAREQALADAGRQVGILAGGYIVCADTEAEAWRRYHYVTREKLDPATADFVELWTRESRGSDIVPVQERVDRMAAGFNALPLVGTAEQIVERMQQMADAGLAGLAISFDDYDEGIAAYDEALRPLLVEAGLRSL